MRALAGGSLHFTKSGLPRPTTVGVDREARSGDRERWLSKLQLSGLHVTSRHDRSAPFPTLAALSMAQRGPTAEPLATTVKPVFEPPPVFMISDHLLFETAISCTESLPFKVHCIW